MHARSAEEANASAARWPLRLTELAAEIGAGSETDPAPNMLEELWLLLHTALSRAFSHQASRYSGLPPEDLEDLVAEKTLALLSDLTAGRWLIDDRAPGEVAGYIATTARNRIVNHLRERGRFVSDTTESGDERSTSAAQLELVKTSPEDELRRRRFAEALRGCAEQLDGSARRAWLFRVFYDMSSREIASHPEVRLKSSHIDVLLQRARRTIRSCMAKKGFDAEDLLPGSFVALWNAFELEWAHEPGVEGGAAPPTPAS